MSDFEYKLIHKDNIFITVFVMSVFISSSYFYNIVFLSEKIILAIQTLVIGVIVLLTILNFILRRNFFKENFSLGIGIILVGSFLSVVSAYLYHHQSPVITIWAQRAMFFYLFYYVLHMLNVSDKKIIELISLTGIIYASCYLIQFFAFPRVIFDVTQTTTRGTIRIYLPGSTFMYAAYFISLQKVLYKKSIKDMILMLFFLTITVLTGTRNSMAMVGFVSFVGIIISKRVKSKFIILMLALACGVSLFYAFYDMFINLIEMSFKQTKNAEEDVRTKAMEFFLTTFMPDKACYFFGNGEPHGSALYGKQIDSYKLMYGYYLSDIGFVGEYVRYGAIFVVGVLVSFVKWIFIKPMLRHIFTKYILLFFLLGLFFAGGWANEESIVMLCCVFYILDISSFELMSQRIKHVIEVIAKSS